MRSRGSRIPLERGLRVAAFVLLALCWWALTTDASTHGRTDARFGEPGQLPAWTRLPPADSILLDLSTAPDPLARDWLRALNAAGTSVAWRGAIPATAMEVVPVADPAGGFVVFAAAAESALVVLADSLGPLDSTRAGRSGAVFGAAAHAGALRMTVASQPAQAAGPELSLERHAVVLGRAGWETRFVITALEERGWTVDARLAVAPGIAVAQGRALPLDTARHAVVVATDSLSAGEAAAIARFVASGGGAVLGPDAARTLRGLAPGSPGSRVRPPSVAFSANDPRASLAVDPVLMRPDAVPLERHSRHVTVAARRAGAGRVVQVAFSESWRWRLGGSDNAVTEHREWWAGVVAAAAYRTETGNRESAIGNRAPLASLVRTLGPASSASPVSRQLPDPRTLLIPSALGLFAVLLAEWVSRRLRGAA